MDKISRYGLAFMVLANYMLLIQLLLETGTFTEKGTLISFGISFVLLILGFVFFAVLGDNENESH